ncbi:MAG: hypothetical protein ACKOYN_12215, partial [Planctomycetota bacterium]
SGIKRGLADQTLEMEFETWLKQSDLKPKGPEAELIGTFLRKATDPSSDEISKALENEVKSSSPRTAR